MAMNNGAVGSGAGEQSGGKSLLWDGEAGKDPDPTKYSQ